METAKEPQQTTRWSFILTVLLAGLLLLLAFQGVDWHDMLATIGQARPLSLMLGFLLVSTTFFLRGLRWSILLGAEKQVSPLTTFWATSVGYLGNSFLPARAGEIMRSVMLGRATSLSKTYVFATAVTERLMDVVALVMLGLFAITSLNGVPAWVSHAAHVMGMLGMAGMLVLIVAPRLEAWFKRMIGFLPLPTTLNSRLMGMLEQFLLGMRAFQHRGRAVSFTGMTLAIWLLDGFIATQIAHALHLHLTLPEALVLLTALGLSSAAPSTPGYVGIYQFVTVTVLAPFDFLRSEALAYILTFQAVNYLVVLVWGFLGLWRLTHQSSTTPLPARLSETDMNTTPHSG